MPEIKSSLLDSCITQDEMNDVFAKIPGSNELDQDCSVSLRISLLVPLLLDIEDKVSPNQDTQSEAVPTALQEDIIINDVMNIIGNPLFVIQENKVFKSICKESESNPNYAKEIYLESLNWVINHLQPENYTSDGKYQPEPASDAKLLGKKILAGLTVSQIYLMTKGGMTYEQLTEFRKEALESALTQTS